MELLLVASPLCGRSSWAPVADALRAAGHHVCVAGLADDGGAPFAAQHLESARRAAAPLPGRTAPAIVGHSGAGPLLPAIAARIGRAGALVYADAGLPGPDGASRLDLLEAQGAPFLGELREQLAAGMRFPAWTDAELAEIVPDRARRRALWDELRPRSLPFFEDPLPVPEPWRDTPSAYLHLSPPYDAALGAAERAGWPVRRLAGGHFHQLVEPEAVAQALVELAGAAARG